MGVLLFFYYMICNKRYLFAKKGLVKNMLPDSQNFKILQMASGTLIHNVGLVLSSRISFLHAD